VAARTWSVVVAGVVLAVVQAVQQLQWAVALVLSAVVLFAEWGAELEPGSK
jgi:hypothetical protein